MLRELDMRQLMHERLAYCLVVPPPIIPVRTQADLNNLALIPIQPQRLALVRGVPRGLHLEQQADRVLVLAHDVLDARVVAQPLEELERRLVVRQVLQRAQVGEAVECGFGGFLPVAEGHGFGRLDGAGHVCGNCTGELDWLGCGVVGIVEMREEMGSWGRRR